MIRRAILTLSAAILLGLLGGTTASAAGWSIDAFGGGAMPMGDFADEDLADAQTGYQFGGAVDYHMNDMWALGVDLSWAKNTHGAEGETIDLGGGDSYTLDSDKFTTMQYGVHARATLPGTGALRYSGLLGIGMYSPKEEWEETTVLGGVTTTSEGESEDITGFGFRLGAGAMYAMNPSWGIGVDVDYNIVSVDEDDWYSSSLNYFGFKGVVRYSLAGGQ
jgi:opacity protein-like surface antigen